jgi:hypothetical protein
MKESRSNWRWSAAFIITGILLLSVYVGAYYALLSEGTFYGEVEVVPHYSLPGEIDLGDWVETFFRPMNWLDRRLRPEVWRPLPAPVACK